MLLVIQLDTPNRKALLQPCFKPAIARTAAGNLSPSLNTTVSAESKLKLQTIYYRPHQTFFVCE